MQIPKLTQQQAFYAIIILLLFVIIWFVVRDFQAQTVINGQVKQCSSNLNWLADRCGCNVEEELAKARSESVFNEKDFNLVFPGS